MKSLQVGTKDNLKGCSIIAAIRWRMMIMKTCWIDMEARNETQRELMKVDSTHTKATWLVASSTKVR